MTQKLNWFREGSTLWLSGDLNQEVLKPLWNRRLEAMQGVTLIDLSAVMRIDTAGIALLAHLVESGKKQGGIITLTGVSNNVLTLVKLYNLPDDVLPFQF